MRRLFLLLRLFDMISRLQVFPAMPSFRSALSTSTLHFVFRAQIFRPR